MSNKTIDEINEQLVNEIKKAMNSVLIVWINCFKKFPTEIIPSIILAKICLKT